MGKAAAQTTTKKTQVNKATNGGWPLAWQLAETTWRVALPIVLFCYGGVRLDRHFNTRPLWSLIGLFSSLFLATLLVYRQIRRAYPEFSILPSKTKTGRS